MISKFIEEYPLQVFCFSGTNGVLFSVKESGKPEEETDSATLDTAVTFSTDTEGHEHKGKGVGGGQFTGKGKSGGEGDSSGKSGSTKKKVTTGAPKGPTYVDRQVAEHRYRSLKKINSYPLPLRLPLKAIYGAGFKTFVAVQKYAKAVASEISGGEQLADEHAEWLGGRLATLDNIANTIADSRFGHRGIGGSLLPPTAIASMSYLLYSTIRHPVATLNVASRIINEAVSKTAAAIGESISKAAVAAVKYELAPITEFVHRWKQRSVKKQEVRALIRAYDRHRDNPEWYAALLTNAMKHTQNIIEVIRLADSVYEKNPNLPQTTTDEDEQVASTELNQMVDSIFGKSRGASLSTEADGKPKDSGKKVGKGSKGKPKRSLFKRLRIKKRWRPSSVSLGMVGDEWHGPKPPGKGWVETRSGPQGGKRWVRGGKSGRRNRSGDVGVGPGGSSIQGQPGKTGQTVASETGRPDSSATGGVRKAGGVAPRPGPAGDTGGLTNHRTQTQRQLSQSERAAVEQVTEELNRYAKHFHRVNQQHVVDWIDILKDHIHQIGPRAALAALGPERTGIAERTGYRTTGEVEDDMVEFVTNYLDWAGITMLGSGHEQSDLRTISSAPTPAAQATKKAGDFVPTEALHYANKLEESKLLPGLESTEDIDVVVGAPVTNLTPDILSKLDERYGIGKWIIKSYSEEAFAGFGVFFPERVEQIQEDARQAIWSAKNKLKKLGFSLTRGEDGTISGIANTSTGEKYEFGTKNFNDISDERIRRLGYVVLTSAPSEMGARLPASPEENLLQNYGISLRRVPDNHADKIVGITDYLGRNIDFGTKQYAKFEVEYGYSTTHNIERAVESASDPAVGRYMVQPAFESVGVSEMDRALGYTWETGVEGRVHVIVHNGKASVVPYATSANRGDNIPVVFTNDNIRAMERAAQEAIDALPPELRTGQVYAPDVMMTKDGWRVVELNASAQEGQSLWLEENPLVIDAFVTHYLNLTSGNTSKKTSREPAHVTFMRNLLRNRVKLPDVTKGIKSVPPTRAPKGKS